MKVAAIDFTKCARARCTKCLAAKACDRRVITKIDYDEPAFIDRALCSGCGDCLAACEHAAITIVES